jgi:transposase
LGVSWNLVKKLVKDDLPKRFSRPRLEDLRQIAIDQVSIGKGLRRLTVVLEPETGMVHQGHGKGGCALLNVWKRLRRLHQRPAKPAHCSQSWTRLQAWAKKWATLTPLP